MTRGKMTVDVLQIAGLDHAMRWMRYAKQTESDTLASPTFNQVAIGPRDKQLAAALLKAPRDSHAKMCRVIQVWLNILAPFTWWKHFDTYKIGTTALSTSTMNSLMQGVLDTDFDETVDAQSIERVRHWIKMKDERRAFGNLPGGYLQLRGVNLNYQVLRNIWLDRRRHKLIEWRVFLDEIRKQVPYGDELIFVERARCNCS